VDEQPKPVTAANSIERVYPVPALAVHSSTHNALRCKGSIIWFQLAVRNSIMQSEEMPTTEDELFELACRARRQRLSGDHHNGEHSEFPLIGKCFDNAYVLYHVLQSEGYAPRLVAGTTERVGDELIQDGVNIDAIESVEEYGFVVHYWIEVDVEGDTWHIDIASDTWKNLGVCLVTGDLPCAYVRFSDSYAEGSELIEFVEEQGDRCTHCGDHAYTEGGCRVCENISAGPSASEPTDTQE